MNTRGENSEIRELTTDELYAVAGGIVGGHAVGDGQTVNREDAAIIILSSVGLGAFGLLVPD